jgi:hypothetical protein
MPVTGPHVQIATFCERALVERDGVLSVIRAIDRLTVTAGGPNVPDEMPTGQRVSPTLVVALRSDQAMGRHRVSIDAEQPDTTRLPTVHLDVMFEGQDRGVNLVLPMLLEAQEGLYWFNIKLDDDQLLSRVPLRIVYQRMPAISE